MMKLFICMFVIVAVVVNLILIGVSWDAKTRKKVSVGRDFPAMFVFGDSLIDCGNNVYFTSSADANYLPFGIDIGGPTGRFTNGLNIVDFLGDLIGLPLLPPSIQTTRGNASIIDGVNYASAGSGILDNSGETLGQRYCMREQVENFNVTLGQLRTIMKEKELREYLAKSLVLINIGANDYIQNYLMPDTYNTSKIYNTTAFADLLVEHYAHNVMELHKLGLRKFLLGGCGPLGCEPHILATEHAAPGTCVEYINDMVKIYNKKLYSLVLQLNSDLKDSVFSYGDSYKQLMDIRDHAASYGFNVTDKACCIGGDVAQLACRPHSIPCPDRNIYMFWDAYHPTQAYQKIAATEVYREGSTTCYPLSVKQMARV